MWRTPDQVRENSDPYRSECMDCVPAGDCGWEIQQRNPASLMWLLSLEATREEGDEQWSKLMSVKSAQEDLIRHLAESSLTAFAIEQASRCPVEIPHREWPYLALIADRPWRDELRFNTDPLRPAYTHVTLQSAEILKIWPAQSIDDEVKTAAPPTKPKRYPQAEVDAALERHKLAWLQDTGPALSTRKWDNEMAPNEFPGISKGQSRKAWKNVAPPGWRGAGRPRNDSPQNAPERTLGISEWR